MTAPWVHVGKWLVIELDDGPATDTAGKCRFAFLNLRFLLPWRDRRPTRREAFDHLQLAHTAPELLEAAIQARAALRTVLADYEPGSVPHGVVQSRIATLDAAIAKARGGAA